MVELVPLEPVDYLVIGHVTEDITPAGNVLGGTVAFSALTARAFGLRVGIITSVSEKTSLKVLQGIPLFRVPSEHTTTFENIRTEAGRTQILHGRAAPISLASMPDVWRRTSIVHLGPIAQEVDPSAPDLFSTSLLGLTPQGWMRTWDQTGRVTPSKWESAESLLPRAGAVVISREDVGGDEELIESMAHQTRILVVTEGLAGSVLYWNGDRRRFRAPEVEEVDSVGSGDIFATAFFIRLFMTRDPWEAARLATLVAAKSVTRPGLAGVPTPKEIEQCTVEVLQVGARGSCRRAGTRAGVIRRMGLEDGIQWLASTHWLTRRAGWARRPPPSTSPPISRTSVSAFWSWISIRRRMPPPVSVSTRTASPPGRTSPCSAPPPGLWS